MGYWVPGRPFADPYRLPLDINEAWTLLRPKYKRNLLGFCMPAAYLGVVNSEGKSAITRAAGLPEYARGDPVGNRELVLVDNDAANWDGWSVGAVPPYSNPAMSYLTMTRQATSAGAVLFGRGAQSGGGYLHNIRIDPSNVDVRYNTVGKWSSLLYRCSTVSTVFSAKQYTVTGVYGGEALKPALWINGAHFDWTTDPGIPTNTGTNDGKDFQLAGATYHQSAVTLAVMWNDVITDIPELTKNPSLLFLDNKDQWVNTGAVAATTYSGYSFAGLPV